VGAREREGSTEAFCQEADEVESKTHPSALFFGGKKGFTEVGNQGVGKVGSLVVDGEGDGVGRWSCRDVDGAGCGFSGISNEAGKCLGDGGFWQKQRSGLGGCGDDDSGKNLGGKNFAERSEDFCDGGWDGGFSEFSGGLGVQATEKGAAAFGF
jgi:hypothetical protein